MARITKAARNRNLATLAFLKKSNKTGSLCQQVAFVAFLRLYRYRTASTFFP